MRMRMSNLRSSERFSKLLRDRRVKLFFNRRTIGCDQSRGSSLLWNDMRRRAFAINAKIRIEEHDFTLDENFVLYCANLFRYSLLYTC